MHVSDNLGSTEVEDMEQDICNQMARRAKLAVSIKILQVGIHQRMSDVQHKPCQGAPLLAGAAQGHMRSRGGRRRPRTRAQAQPSNPSRAQFTASTLVGRGAV